MPDHSIPRILLVDDDPRLARIVAMYLEMEGYDVVTAADARAAMVEIDAHLPDLLILDIMLPGVDGISLCEQVRRAPHTSGIPVVMFTALSGIYEVERARLAGANHLVTKPFNLPGLEAVVRSLLPSSVPEPVRS